MGADVWVALAALGQRVARLHGGGEVVDAGPAIDRPNERQAIGLRHGLTENLGATDDEDRIGAAPMARHARSITDRRGWPTAKGVATCECGLICTG